MLYFWWRHLHWEDFLQSAICGLQSANVIHREKLETEPLFLQDVNIRDWNVLPVLGNDISSRYSKDFVHTTKQKRIEKIVFQYGYKIYKQSRLNLKCWMKMAPS